MSFFSEIKKLNFQMNWELYLNTVFEGSNVSLNQISFMQVYTPYLQILATALSATPPTTVGEAKKFNFRARKIKQKKLYFRRGADVVAGGGRQRAAHHQVAKTDPPSVRRGRHLRTDRTVSVQKTKKIIFLNFKLFTFLI